MRYLILSAVYLGSCLIDEFNGEVDLNSLGISPELIEEITLWQNSYAKFIPMSNDQRLSFITEMEKLDVAGIEIAKKLQLLIPGNAKVKYFSELKSSLIAY
jgi:hypothetical protein